MRHSLAIALATVMSLSLAHHAALAAVPPAPWAVLMAYNSPLLSGGVTDCPTNNATACRGGLAGHMGFMRYLKKQVANGAMPNTIFLPIAYADRNSIFAQMHPYSWGVNGIVFDYFGMSGYFAVSSIMDEVRPGMTYLRRATARMTSANAFARASHVWFGFLTKWLVDSTGTFAVTSLYDELSYNSDDSLTSTNNAIQQLAETYPNLTTTIVFNGGAMSLSKTLRLASIANPPSIVLIERAFDTPSSFVTTRINNTWFMAIDQIASTLTLNISLDMTTGAPSATTAPNATAYDMATIATSFYRDSQWVTDQAFLRTEALKATLNDPLLSVAADPMPLHRTGNFRLCMGGECPAGDLFCDGMRYTFNSDICFTNSGGYRGNGWSTGANITISQLWTLVPFANRVCTGTVMGLTLYEMFNYSTTLAQYNTTLTLTGNHFFQVAGMRLAIDYTRAPSDGRLITIQIFNRSSSTWENIKRFGLYSYAIESFLCQSFAPYTAILQRAKYPGEVASKVTDTVMQDAIATYIKSKTPTISHALDGRIVLVDSSTNATLRGLLKPLVWNETQMNCQADTYWSPTYDSCLPCPTGLVQPASGQLSCVVPPPAPSYVGYYVGIPSGAVVGLALLAMLIRSELQRRKNVRNTANAPTGKNGESITIVFTDIQTSTKLWSTCPASMSIGLDQHHAAIRKCIADHHAYEVKTIGDSFMIACQSASQGIDLAVAIQQELMTIPFPAAIDECYRMQGDEDVDDNPDRIAQPVAGAPWNGIRVRCGIHTGHPEVTFDEVAKGYDYYGPPVNVAARVESVTDGGQVCCSKDTLTQLLHSDAYKLSSIGEIALKGVPEPLQVFSVDTGIRGRVFTKSANTVDRDDNDDDTKSEDLGRDPMEIFRDNIINLAVVQKGDLPAIAAISQVTLIADSFIELFRVTRGKIREEMVEKFVKGWHTRPRPDDSIRSLRDLAVKVFPGVLRASRLGAGSSRMGSARPQKHSSRGGGGGGGMGISGEDSLGVLPNQVTQVESFGSPLTTPEPGFGSSASN